MPAQPDPLPIEHFRQDLLNQHSQRSLFSRIMRWGFALLVAWVYWPSRRNKLEALGEIPLDSDMEVETEKPNE